MYVRDILLRSQTTKLSMNIYEQLHSDYVTTCFIILLFDYRLRVHEDVDERALI